MKLQKETLKSKQNRLANEWKVTINKDTKRDIEHQLLLSVDLYIKKASNSYSLQRSGVNQDMLNELIQEGSLGVLKSLHKWDPEKALESNNSFFSYTCFWIKKYMLMHLDSKVEPVKIPAGKKSKALKLLNSGELPGNYNKYLTKYINIDGDKVKKDGEKNNVNVCASYGKYSQDTPDKDIINKDVSIIMKEALNTITNPKERYIIYSLSTGKEIQEISKELGVSATWIYTVRLSFIKSIRNNKVLIGKIKDWIV